MSPPALLKKRFLLLSSDRAFLAYFGTLFLLGVLVGYQWSTIASSLADMTSSGSTTRRTSSSITRHADNNTSSSPTLPLPPFLVATAADVEQQRGGDSTAAASTMNKGDSIAYPPSTKQIF